MFLFLFQVHSVPLTMSCFSGSFLSLPGVRCDKFDSLAGDGTTQPAQQFFLSHCHSDHMVNTILRYVML